MSSHDGELTFLEHLEELRWRLIKGLVSIVIFAIPCGIYWDRIFDLVMIYPLRFTNPRPKLIVTSPVEAVMLSLKIAIAGGIICAAPVIFYQVWRFIAPGLYKQEKAVVLPTVFFSTMFFLGGVGFCYLILPYLVQFLVSFGSGRMDAMYRMNEYLSFLIKLCLAFGVVFELPVISFVLTKVGVLKPQFLVQKSRYAIVIIFIVAAVLTPPDVLSQILLAIPLLLLYGLSILVSYAVVRGKE
jgi:sec-independent protein translocase protein TatC